MKSNEGRTTTKLKTNDKMKTKKMKNINNKMKNKNKGTTTINITKTSLEVLPSKVIKKKDYRSVIKITFVSHIILHVVAILLFNKDNG